MYSSYKQNYLFNISFFIYTYSVWPWKTDTECTDSLKSHNLNVVSLDEVTANFCVGCVEQSVSSWSCPVSVLTTVPVSTSCNMAHRSQEAVITCSAPTSQSAAVTAPTWPSSSHIGVRSVSTRESMRSSFSSPISSSSSDEWPFWNFVAN